MIHKTTVLVLMATALASAPITEAHADGWHHHSHGGGPGIGLIAGVAALVGAAAYVATAPIRMVAEAAAPTPAYAAPAYYPPQRQVVYAYPQPYPAPVYAYPTYAYPTQ